MNFFMLFLSFLFAFNVQSKDITASYNKYYSNSGRLSSIDLSYLKGKDIILIPGILSEVFSREDRRGKVDFSILTSDYFSAQVKHLKHTLNLSTQKLLSSSLSVLETKALIAEALRKSKRNNRKAILITHSLGGLALLDYLIELDESEWTDIEGVLFLQTPFFGSPIADIFFDNPYHADKWLRPLLPFFNTSIETVEYLTIENRMNFMADNKEQISKVLAKIPTITMSGVTNGHRSVFTPAADVIEYGCLINAKGFCLTGILHQGPYDLSDGMVPLNSSRIENVDSIVLEGVDHGDPIVKLPFQKLSKVAMTESLIKMLLNRSRKD